MDNATAILELLKNNAIDGWPSEVDMKVIDPGVVHYEDLLNSNGERVGGNVLVQKETLDKMANSLKGKPIINWDHRSVNPKEYGKGKFQGIVTEVYYNSIDGHYHAKGYVWDEATRKNIENGFSISCAYTVSDWGDGGTYHQVPYVKEVRNGSYTHIAVVPVPRYESARIELLNSAKGGIMGLLSLFRKDKTEEKVDIDMSTAKVAVEGIGDVALEELVNSFKKSEAIKAAAGKTLGLTDVIELDGKKVSIQELVNSHLAFYNEAEEKDLKEKHNSGGHSVPMKNCAMCNAAEDEKKKEDDEKKNAAEEEKKKKDEEAKNAADEDKKKKDEEDKKNAIANAKKLEEMRNNGKKLEMPEIKSLSALMAEGEDRYGKMPVSAAK